MRLERKSRTKPKSSGRIKRIHVNKQVIAQNLKRNETKPPLTVKTARSNDYGHEVEVLGNSKLVYSPHKPLNCGARLWIETRAVVRITEHLSGEGSNRIKVTEVI